MTRSKQTSFFLVFALLFLVSFTNYFAYADDSPGSYITKLDDTTDGATAFIVPVGVAADSNNRIIVTDIIGGTVQIFNSDGSYANKLDSGGLQFPNGITVDSEDRIIVGSSFIGGIDELHIFNPDGSFHTSFDGTDDGGVPFNSIFAVAADSEGRIIVVDSDLDMVRIFNPDGTYITKLDDTTGGATAFGFPNGVAVDSNNRIIVSNLTIDEVQIFNPDGSFLTSLVSITGGVAAFNDPVGVAVDSNDRIIVVDSTSTVQIFNPDGSFLTSFVSITGGGVPFDNSRAVAVDSNDRIIVVDSTSTVHIFKGTSALPEIKLLGDDPQVINQYYPYEELDATCSDDVDGDNLDVTIDASNVDDTIVGTYEVFYYCEDAAGNPATKIRTVHVEDNTAPEIKLNGDDPQVINQYYLQRAQF